MVNHTRHKNLHIIIARPHFGVEDAVWLSYSMQTIVVG